MPLHFISRARDDPPSRIVASPLAEALHFNGGGTTSVSSAHPSSWGGTTSVSSAFPRSERVYPAIMPLGEIRPGVKPVATSASGGMTSASSAHRPQSWRLRLRRPSTLIGEGRPPGPTAPVRRDSSGRPSTKSPHS